VPIAFADELVRSESAALSRKLLSTALYERQILPRHLPCRASRRLIHQHDLGPKGTHHLRPLSRVSARHDRDKRIALDGANDSKTGPHVAAGQLDNRLSGSKSSRPFGFFDDSQRDPVLFGEARIQVIQLQEYSPGQGTRYAGQLEQRRIADCFSKGRNHSRRVLRHRLPTGRKSAPLNHARSLEARSGSDTQPVTDSVRKVATYWQRGVTG